jgi:hypothetical protein
MLHQAVLLVLPWVELARIRAAHEAARGAERRAALRALPFAPYLSAETLGKLADAAECFRVQPDQARP